MSDPFFERVGTQTYPAAGNSLAQLEWSPVPPVPSNGEPDRLRAIMTGSKRWASSHDSFWGATQTHDALPPGLYRCSFDQNTGPVLKLQKTETDNLLELPDDASASIIQEFETFWQIGDAFRQRGFLHKRGFLLWGPPGSGKTSTVHLLVKRLIEAAGGVILFLDHPQVASACLQLARSIEPKRPMIAIMEDFDALVRKYGENEYLALLDGEAQVDNIVFLATTNYPENLDRRFVDRPSRFDTIRFIGMPSADARRVYLSTKEPSLEGAELDRWVAASDGFSVAHLKEMIIAVRCFGQPLDAVTKRLEEMQARQPTSDDAPDRHGVGFIGHGLRAA